VRNRSVERQDSVPDESLDRLQRPRGPPPVFREVDRAGEGAQEEEARHRGPESMDLG